MRFLYFYEFKSSTVTFLLIIKKVCKREKSVLPFVKIMMNSLIPLLADSFFHALSVCGKKFYLPNKSAHKDNNWLPEILVLDSHLQTYQWDTRISSCASPEKRQEARTQAVCWGESNYIQLLSLKH